MSVSDEGYGIPEILYFLFLSLWAYLMKVTVYQKHSIFYFFHYERIWWRLLPEKGRDYWYLDWYCFCNLKKKSKYTHVIDKICYQCSTKIFRLSRTPIVIVNMILDFQGRRGHRLRDSMVVGFITTFAISTYHQ